MLSFLSYCNQVRNRTSQSVTYLVDDRHNLQATDFRCLVWYPILEDLFVFVVVEFVLYHHDSTTNHGTILFFLFLSYCQGLTGLTYQSSTTDHYPQKGRSSAPVESAVTGALVVPVSGSLGFSTSACTGRSRRSFFQSLICDSATLMASTKIPFLDT